MFEITNPFANSPANRTVNGPRPARKIGIPPRGSTSSFTPAAENTFPAYATRSPASSPRTIRNVSRNAGTGRSASNPICRTAAAIPDPTLNDTRPPDISSSAAISIAINVGCRLNGLNTPAPIDTRRVATAQAAANGKIPRPNAFSANQRPSKPASSAAFAMASAS